MRYSVIFVSDFFSRPVSRRRNRRLAFVPANDFDTTMENIRYGKLGATDEACIAAAKLANAHDFIMRLPNGYDTELSGDGGSLSQGQRQLLSIARAEVFVKGNFSKAGKKGR